jgi:hypothetical protein
VHMGISDLVLLKINKNNIYKFQKNWKNIHMYPTICPTNVKNNLVQILCFFAYPGLQRRETSVESACTFRGEDLYRIAALGRIIGSVHKNHFFKL